MEKDYPMAFMPGPQELVVIFGMCGLPLILVAGIAYLIYRLVRARAQNNETRCRKCGYILRGITEPRCPECGTSI
jgi:predicted RNA-binding Zn-ribbon protein involved in translation (DUF1610 family)